jgi:uncharacterized protein
MFNNNLLKQTEHRPFPLPNGPWIMTQTWNHVLFAHWPISLESIRDKIPDQLEIDMYNQNAWIGILPFYLNHLRLRNLPPIPLSSAFPELNVRTYVTYKGIPGIYFFSLDADHQLAVLSARTFFHLPYYYAKMEIILNKDEIEFKSTRRSSNQNAEMVALYHPVSKRYHHQKDTMEYWLTERYRFYTTHKGDLYYEDIHHLPWSLQKAEAEFSKNTLLSALDIDVINSSPLLHYSESQKVLFWPIHRIET